MTNQEKYKYDFKNDIKIFIRGYRRGVIEYLPLMREVTRDTYHLGLYKDAIKELDYEEHKM